MSAAPFLTLAVAITAGLLGSLLGLGGGIIIVPALTLLFGVPIRTAVAASTVSIIATSSGAAANYLRARLTNTRVAMWLEMATALGALTGAMLAGLLEPRYLFFLFGALTVYSAITMYRGRKAEHVETVVPDAVSQRLHLAGSYHDKAIGRQVEYHVTRPAWGLLGLYFSGVAAAMLGIGGGVFNVLAMDRIMKMPIKAATATSNFIIGITAASGAMVYFMRGDVKAAVAGPVALGVLIGSFLGTRVMVRLKGSTLRLLFIPLLLVMAVQMVWKGVRL